MCQCAYRTFLHDSAVIDHLLKLHRSLGAILQHQEKAVPAALPAGLAYEVPRRVGLTRKLQNVELRGIGFQRPSSLAPEVGAESNTAPEGQGKRISGHLDRLAWILRSNR